jgi:hypothetical protein
MENLSKLVLSYPNLENLLEPIVHELETYRGFAMNT